MKGKFLQPTLGKKVKVCYFPNLYRGANNFIFLSDIGADRVASSASSIFSSKK